MKSIKSLAAMAFARLINSRTEKWRTDPVSAQNKTFKKLMTGLSGTAFGRAHNISPDTTQAEFRQNVPIRDYEGLKEWFDRISSGEKDVCWPGKPVYLAKTSGTTSGAKYIPITKDSIPNHIRSARNALLNYMLKTGNSQFVDGKLIFLSGSPILDKKNGIFTGRLSGIVNHHVPDYLRKNQMPSWETNCMEDWEEKVKAIAEETAGERMTLISGIPPWVQMYFDLLIEKHEGKKVGEIFPDFSIFVYGGVNMEPYRKKLSDSIGRDVDMLELFPASEGFFAYQDVFPSQGLLLLADEGIYYEFVPADRFFDENPPRLALSEVELGVNYALIINSNAGLWGYSIGDTIKFVSLHPHRIVVTGRIKHFISAFGEHVIGEEVEFAMNKVSAEFGVSVTEFTVAPMVNPQDGLPHHEWFVEFKDAPGDPEKFAIALDDAMQSRNIYYRDLITGSVLRPLVVRSLQPQAFIQYMKSQGKLGGQNKVPRLSNDRKIADEMMRFTL